MDFGSFIEAGSSAVLNELLSSFHDDDGMAFPSKYEVLFLPPSGTRGTGCVGASTNLPVIGVPINSSSLGGVDALLSTIQMPPGIPVATMGIGSPGARNAALFAARILSLEDSKILEKYKTYVEKQKQKVLDSDRSIQNR